MIKTYSTGILLSFILTVISSIPKYLKWCPTFPLRLFFDTPCDFVRGWPFAFIGILVPESDSLAINLGSKYSQIGQYLYPQALIVNLVFWFIVVAIIYFFSKLFKKLLKT